MDPLQHFEEEYSSLQESISNLSAILTQSHDVYLEIVHLKKILLDPKLFHTLNPEQTKQFLLSITQLSSLAVEMIESVQSAKSFLSKNGY